MTDRFLSRWSRRKAATRPASIMSAPKVEHELPTIVPERPEAEEAEDPVVAAVADGVLAAHREVKKCPGTHAEVVACEASPARDV